MTKISFLETDMTVTIEMLGHAEYDSTGKDIVCAACSVLIQSLINALHVLNVPNGWIQNDGEVELSFQKTRDWKGAYTVARVGFEMLAKSYPNNVTITD